MNSNKPTDTEASRKQHHPTLTIVQQEKPKYVPPKPQAQPKPKPKP